MKKIITLLALLTYTLPAFASTPNVLSSEDVTTYKKMFAYQRALKTDDVTALTPTLENPLLLGHVEAELLLHPNTKSSYANLSAWLAKHDDLPQAPVISRLAKSRSPDTLLTALIKESSAANYRDPDEAKLPKGKTKPLIKDPKTKADILKSLKQHIKASQYLDAYKILSQRYARKLLGDTLWAERATDLGRYLLNRGYFSEAEKLGLIAAAHKSRHQLDALWQSAFASYRQDKVDAALKTFQTLLTTANDATSHYARAAFWLGRINAEQGRADTAAYYFRIAAQNKTDFYGLLARARLPQSEQDKITPDLWQPTANPEDVKILMSHSAAKRVIALSQVGEYALAQKELKRLRKDLPYRMDETLLAVSLERNLPNAAFIFGYNLKQRGNLSLPGLFPTPTSWTDNTDLHGVSPALVFAIMRQESAFDPTIVSRVGARGLMQIMPATSKYILSQMGREPMSSHRLNRPHISVDLGAWYISYLMRALDDNLLDMVAAYNGGIGNVKKWHKREHLKDADALVFMESIPFNETRKYAKKVFANYWIYQHQMGEAMPTKLALAQGFAPIVIAGR